MVELSDERLKELKDSFPRKVGARIKYFRRKKELTQTELAQAVGKDRQYLYKIEKGIVTPNIVTIYSLVLALEVSLKEFYDF